MGEFYGQFNYHANDTNGEKVYKMVPFKNAANDFYLYKDIRRIEYSNMWTVSIIYTFYKFRIGFIVIIIYVVI